MLKRAILSKVTSFPPLQQNIRYFPCRVHLHFHISLFSTSLLHARCLREIIDGSSKFRMLLRSASAHLLLVFSIALICWNAEHFTQQGSATVEAAFDVIADDKATLAMNLTEFSSLTIAEQQKLAVIPLVQFSSFSDNTVLTLLHCQVVPALLQSSPASKHNVNLHLFVPICWFGVSSSTPLLFMTRIIIDAMCW